MDYLITELLTADMAKWQDCSQQSHMKHLISELKDKIFLENLKNNHFIHPSIHPSFLHRYLRLKHTSAKISPRWEQGTGANWQLSVMKDTWAHEDTSHTFGERSRRKRLGAGLQQSSVFSIPNKPISGSGHYKLNSSKHLCFEELFTA